MDEELKKPTENILDCSSSSKEKVVQTFSLDNSPIEAAGHPDSGIELSNSSKKRKKTDEISTIPTTSDNVLDCTTAVKLKADNQSTENSTPLHYQDISFHSNTTSYCSFVSMDKKPLKSFSKIKTESVKSTPVQQLVHHVSTDPEFDEEDEEKAKIAAARKRLFPDPIATSFSEVSDTLRNERRQEFCPIYNDETSEQIALRRPTQKPVGSLLAKRIRWDDLKRKRGDEERKAEMQYHYGPYGPIHNNQQPSQQSFTNPYERYCTAMQNQYDYMTKMSHAQQEHSGFWPEYYQQASYQNNDQIAQNSMQQQQQQQQPQPYTYPYPSMNSHYMTLVNTNPPSYTTADYYNLYAISHMQPPPPPPDEP